MRTILFSVCFLCVSLLQAQIPFELFGGHQRSTVDLMFFKFLKTKTVNSENHKDRLLFFNRNRASIDYRMTSSEYLPQFGFTEALSYNHEKLKGFAPVLVGQVISWGVYAKAGVQFAHIKKNFTVFTWMVSELKSEPDLDYFLLLRYTPSLSTHWNFFSQLESVNAFPTDARKSFNFTQRIRLGLQRHTYQFGLGLDMSETGRNTYNTFYNAGLFLRHEF